MSDTPWTPGPWEWVEADEAIYSHPDEDSWDYILSTEALEGRGSATIRLIAAAPEMAELLAGLAQNKGATAPPDWWYRTNALLSRIRGEA